MSKLQKIRVNRIQALTADSCAIYFKVPMKDREWHFSSGQYISLEIPLNGEKLRRSYSICTSPKLEKAGLLGRKKLVHLPGIAVKRVEGGKISTYLNSDLKIGDEIDLLPPEGKFTIPQPKPEWIGMVAAGSGITPMMSHLYHLLEESNSKVVLCYGNQSWKSVMFKKELEKLEEKYPDRFFLYHFLSREANQEKHPQVVYGRIKPSTAFKIIRKHSLEAKPHYFICGPADLIQATKKHLKEVREVEARRIHIEWFEAPDSKKEAVEKEVEESGSVHSKARVILGGETHEVDIPEGSRILDAVLAAGLDAPFSCQSGVCCTCQAKGEPGDFITDDCLSLSEDEIKEGHVLTCVGQVRRPEVTINYDV